MKKRIQNAHVLLDPMFSLCNTLYMFSIFLLPVVIWCFATESCSAIIRPVAHFGFDEIDKSDSATAENSVGIDGTYYGPDDMYLGINDIPEGVFGRAISFGPGAGHVSLPQSGIGGAIDSLKSFSIMAWVGKGQASILGQFGDSWEGIHLLARNSYVPGPLGSITLYTGSSRGSSTTYFSQIPLLDRSLGFQHVAVTYSPEHARLYLDAELIVEFEVPGGVVPSGQEYFIGGARGVHSAGISRMELDELWIYDGALSQQQITHVFKTNALVPEPTSMALLNSSTVVLVLRRRR